MEPHIEDIIIRELKHQASAEELSELKEWIHRDAANEIEYESIQRIWQESASVVTSHSFDTACAWEKIQDKIKINTIF